jgi:hypothetical protein
VERSCIGDKIQEEDHEFIVTRATTAIALHLLHTDLPSDTIVSLVLTTHMTYSTKYRRSSYAPGFTNKQNNQT